MAEIVTARLDLATNVFQLHGAGASGRAVLRRKLRRGRVLAGLARRPSCAVALEACGGDHPWGREIGTLGREVRLIPFCATNAAPERSLDACPHVKPLVSRTIRRMPRPSARGRAGRAAVHRSNGSIEGDEPAPEHAAQTGEGRGDAGRGGRPSGARIAEPAAHADDRHLARPRGRVRWARPPGGVERTAPGRADRGRGRRATEGAAHHLAGSARWPAPSRRADRRSGRGRTRSPGV